MVINARIYDFFDLFIIVQIKLWALFLIRCSHLVGLFGLILKDYQSANKIYSMLETFSLQSDKFQPNLIINIRVQLLTLSLSSHYGDFKANFVIYKKVQYVST